MQGQVVLRARSAEGRIGESPGAEELRRAAARAVKTAKRLGLNSLRIARAARSVKSWGNAGDYGRALAEGAAMGGYIYTGGKSKPAISKLARCVIAGRRIPV